MTKFSLGTPKDSFSVVTADFAVWLKKSSQNTQHLRDLRSDELLEVGSVVESNLVEYSIRDPLCSFVVIPTPVDESNGFSKRCQMYDRASLYTVRPGGMIEDFFTQIQIGDTDGTWCEQLIRF